MNVKGEAERTALGATIDEKKRLIDVSKPAKSTGNEDKHKGKHDDPSIRASLTTIVRVDEDGGEEHGTTFLWGVPNADKNISSTAVVEMDDDLIHSLQYSPDGRYFASGADNGTVRLWNAGDNSCAMVMTGDMAPVYSIAFSPNGKLLASAGGGGNVRLWSVEGGDSSCLVNLLEHHVGAAHSVAFSPDGQTLASSGRDGTVHLWNPREEDQTQFKQIDWETFFSLWNFRKE